jgi:hypothetical protein
MEYVSLLAGEPFSDTPACTHTVLAKAAQIVNDRLSDADRHLLVPLIGRLFGTADTRDDAQARRILSVRLAVWCARSVEHLIRPQDRDVCRRAVDAAEAWADDPTEQNATAANAAYAATAGNAAYAANAAAATAAAATAANAAAATAATANAANANAATANAANANAAAATAATATAATAAYANDLIQFLTGLLDEHQRLTGNTARDVTVSELTQLASEVGAA